ncbi:MAG: hypothetical protein OER87_13660, partial [Gammaproteobacteria bacterium]|nr:hypothetical protein [Gammaproteobacteria bacterium]
MDADLSALRPNDFEIDVLSTCVSGLYFCPQLRRFHENHGKWKYAHTITNATGEPRSVGPHAHNCIGRPHANRIAMILRDLVPG